MATNNYLFVLKNFLYVTVLLCVPFLCGMEYGQLGYGYAPQKMLPTAVQEEGNVAVLVKCALNCQDTQMYYVHTDAVNNSFTWLSDVVDALAQSKDTCIDPQLLCQPVITEFADINLWTVVWCAFQGNGRAQSIIANLASHLETKTGYTYYIDYLKKVAASSVVECQPDNSYYDAYQHSQNYYEQPVMYDCATQTSRTVGTQTGDDNFISLVQHGTVYKKNNNDPDSYGTDISSETSSQTEESYNTPEVMSYRAAALKNIVKPVGIPSSVVAKKEKQKRAADVPKNVRPVEVSKQLKQKAGEWYTVNGNKKTPTTLKELREKDEERKAVKRLNKLVQPQQVQKEEEVKVSVQKRVVPNIKGPAHESGNIKKKKIQPSQPSLLRAMAGTAPRLSTFAKASADRRRTRKKKKKKATSSVEKFVKRYNGSEQLLHKESNLKKGQKQLEQLMQEIIIVQWDCQDIGEREKFGALLGKIQCSLAIGCYAGTDNERALKVLGKAAENGSVFAQKLTKKYDMNLLSEYDKNDLYAVASLYNHMNDERSSAFLQAAADKGHPEAIKIVAKIN